MLSHLRVEPNAVFPHAAGRCTYAPAENTKWRPKLAVSGSFHSDSWTFFTVPRKEGGAVILFCRALRKRRAHHPICEK